MTKAKYGQIKWPTTVTAPWVLGELDWQEQSSCQWYDADLFDPFHRGATADDWARVEKAQKVCAECPVRAQCLEFGISQRESGVYGGVYLSNGHSILNGSPVRKESLRRERTAA